MRITHIPEEMRHCPCRKHLASTLAIADLDIGHLQCKVRIRPDYSVSAYWHHGLFREVHHVNIPQLPPIPEDQLRAEMTAIMGRVAADALRAFPRMLEGLVDIDVKTAKD